MASYGLFKTQDDLAASAARNLDFVQGEDDGSKVRFDSRGGKGVGVVGLLVQSCFPASMAQNLEQISHSRQAHLYQLGLVETPKERKRRFLKASCRLKEGDDFPPDPGVADFCPKPRIQAQFLIHTGGETVHCQIRRVLIYSLALVGLFTQGLNSTASRQLRNARRFIWSCPPLNRELLGKARDPQPDRSTPPDYPYTCV